ncbi:MAG: hypothetical protein MJZ76_01205 [Bacteroidales bacterium]|nr:hypothetical protein [Bacteroidales bacterium]
MRLQKYAEKQLQGYSGSVVAIEPATGEILCIVSSPSYDPNLLVGRQRGKNYIDLQNDTKNKPLFNRALSAMYPPGSTFKLANALIGLQEGIITPSTSYYCAFGYNMGSHTVKCHHSGYTDLYGAIQTSCNGYFCKLYYNILSNRKKYKTIQEAYQAWRNYMISFGFGQKFESDLPYETRGIIPSVEYFDKQYLGHWNGNTVVSMGIGQGEVAVTPLQMANFMALVANRGYYIKPHVIKAIGTKDNVNERYTEKIYCGVDPKYFIPVIDGMERVMQSGTGWRSNVKDIRIAGKTGTAQNPHGRDHSVFAAFAPVDTPKIAVFVLVENGGFGATIAAPVATSVIEYYLKDDARRKEMDQELDAKLNAR